MSMGIGMCMGKTLSLIIRMDFIWMIVHMHEHGTQS
jgi:hypothetical protein